MFLKWLVLLWMFSWCFQSFAQYHQNDYNVKLKIMELVDVNLSYASNAIIGMQWFNRTTRVINGNGTLIKDLGMQLKVQVYKFLSNEYRFFPLTMTLNLCDEVPRNMFGIKEVLKNYTNLPLACPVKKNFYYIRHGQLDMSQFPPYMPTGDYKLAGKLFNGDDYGGEIDVYSSITDNRKL